MREIREPIKDILPLFAPEGRYCHTRLPESGIGTTPRKREFGASDPTSGLNPAPAMVMHIDLNSCFAAIEQQANPRLRGQPTVVAAYPTGGGCVLAASLEAKTLGIKTGLKVREAQKIYPQINVLTPDPPKYRYVNQLMMKIFQSYPAQVFPKSIDEAVLVFQDFLPPAQSDGLKSTPPQSRLKQTLTIQGPDRCGTSDERPTKGEPLGLDSERRVAVPFEAELEPVPNKLTSIARQIKRRIKQEIGEWLTVSIGLAPNRFLAKTAAGLKKPDGLEEINHQNLRETLAKLQLRDLCGISFALERRLNAVSILSPLDFLNSDLFTLKSAFRSINAYHWYQRLRGFEVDDYPTERKSLGHSYALTLATNDLKTLEPILLRLCEKVGRRLRAHGYQAQGVWLGLGFKDGARFQSGRKLAQPIYASEDIFNRGHELLRRGLDPLGSNPNRSPVAILAVSVFNLSPSLYQQQTLFETPGVDGLDSGSLSLAKKKSLWQALDKINNKFGEFIVGSGRAWGLEKKIKDRIAFGGIKDLPQFEFPT